MSGKFMTGSNFTSRHHFKIIVAVITTTLHGFSYSFASEYPDAGEIEKITEKWKCQWCPAAESDIREGNINAGVGYITNDSFKHGDYSGLEEKGGYLLLDGEYQYRNNNDEYINANAEDLGLDSRQAGAEGGATGKYKLKVNYSELPKLNSDTARTPYSGEANKRLTGGGGFGSTTQNMAQLNNELRNIDIETLRRQYQFSGSFYQSPELSYHFSFTRESKEGSKTAGLALGNSFALARSAVLAIPVDYLTNQGDFSVSYNARRWMADITYQFSKFENDNESVKWHNAFTEPAGVTEGQAALEPDNTMHQIMFSGLYRLTSNTNAKGMFAVGKFKQDDTFLPYTINGSLSPSPLPRNSLNGEITTFDATLSLLSNINEQLRVKTVYQQHEQDNDTPRTTYDYVVADTSISANSRANFPYSFRQQRLNIQGGYQIRKNRKIIMDYQAEKYDRTYQEVESTEEHSVSVKYLNDVNDELDYAVSLGTADRNGDNYQAQSEIIPGENPLLRKYNLADRKQENAGINITYKATPAVQMGVAVNYSNDDYSNSDLGLQESRQTGYIFDIFYRYSEKLLLLFDYTLSEITSRQLGSQSFSIADWSARNNDDIATAHIGARYEIITNKFNVGFDYAYMKSSGNIDINPGEAFPELKIVRHTVSLFGEYRLDESSMLKAFYRYEDYEEENWAVDGIAPNSIPNVLTLGEVSPNYDIGFLAITYKYWF